MAKILFIEDVQSTVMEYMSYLHRRGNEVYYSQNGIIGLKKLEEINPEIVILDIGEDQLPGKNEKYTLSEEIKRRKPFVKIIGTSIQTPENHETKHYDKIFEKSYFLQEEKLERMIRGLL